MKYISFLFLLTFLFLSSASHAQLEKVIVEKYYVSDNNDSTDLTDGRMLKSGSTTYRVYIDLNSGYKLKKLYGDANHALKIASTDTFYNNIDRPTAYFGYLINKSWFPSNPLLGLDSWITLGLATKTNSGVLKSDDSDGSFIGGNNNYGGSAGIAGGLLVNTDSTAGIPLITSDGMMVNNIIYSQWADNGFKDASNIDTTVFGSVNSGSQFISNSAYLQQNTGVSGANPDSNKILIAQLTTKGTLTFELNIEVMDSSGNTINYIAKGQNSSTGDTLVSPLLTYPPLCGCTDPDYLEYNSVYACSNNDSCKTKIKFGCMDSKACNFDSEANFNIPALCCYPGYCNDRNIAVVCPGLNNGRFDISDFTIYPNPANQQINLQISANKNQNIAYRIYNSFGSCVITKNTETGSGDFNEMIDISKFESGLYLVKLITDGKQLTKTFIKQ